MKAAYEIFVPFSENGFQTERQYLEGMNADFTEKLERTLEIIRGKKLGNLRENLNNYIKAAEDIYIDMIGTDEGLAEHMEVTGGE